MIFGGDGGPRSFGDMTPSPAAIIVRLAGLLQLSDQMDKIFVLSKREGCLMTQKDNCQIPFVSHVLTFGRRQSGTDSIYPK